MTDGDSPWSPSFEALMARLHDFVGLPCPVCRREMKGVTIQRVWPERWNRPSFLPSEVRKNPLLPTIDHLVPTSRGGPYSDPHNIRVVCLDCNRRKGTKTHTPPFHLCSECRHPGSWHYVIRTVAEDSIPEGSALYGCQACSLGKHREWWCGPMGAP